MARYIYEKLKDKKFEKISKSYLNKIINEDIFKHTSAFDISKIISKLVLPSLLCYNEIDYKIKNRNGKEISGKLFKSNNDSLILFDAGLRTGVEDFPELGIYLAKTGYDVVSIEGGDEVYATEAYNYLDSIKYFAGERKMSWKYIFAVGLSSGGVVALKLASNKEALKMGLKAAIVVDSYYDLIEMWNYGKEYLSKTSKDNPRRKVFESYFKYAEERGVDPEMNFSEFYIASPKSFCYEVLLPVLIVHGMKDEIVPIEQGIELYFELKKYDKEVSFKAVLGEGIHSPGIFSSFENFYGIMQTVCAVRRFMEEMKKR